MITALCTSMASLLVRLSDHPHRKDDEQMCLHVAISVGRTISEEGLHMTNPSIHNCTNPKECITAEVLSTTTVNSCQSCHMFWIPRHSSRPRWHSHHPKCWPIATQTCPLLWPVKLMGIGSCTNLLKPITFTSRSLSSADTNYS